jgi:hypothetical protein
VVVVRVVVAHRVEVQSKVAETAKPRNCRAFQGCAGAI